MELIDMETGLGLTDKSLPDNRRKTIETKEKAEKYIRAEVRKNGITINKEVDIRITKTGASGNYRVSQLSYTFLGTKGNVTSIYECNCELKGLFIKYTTPLWDRLHFDDIECCYATGETHYYAVGDTVNINNLTPNVDNMKYGRVLCVDDMMKYDSDDVTIIYQPDDGDGYDYALSYLNLSWDSDKKDWKLITDDICCIVRKGNDLYLLLDEDLPEEDSFNTPYKIISATNNGIKRIRDITNEYSKRFKHPSVHYYEYREVYGDDNLILYSLGVKNYYHVVLDYDIIHNSRLHNSIADLLFIRNNYFIKLSGEIAYIKPVLYNKCEDYYINNKEHYSRNYRDVSVNCYGSNLGCMDDPKRNLYVIKYKGGKTEFFLIDDIKQKETELDKGKTPKKLTYIGRKQQIDND